MADGAAGVRLTLALRQVCDHLAPHCLDKSDSRRRLYDQRAAPGVGLDQRAEATTGADHRADAVAWEVTIAEAASDPRAMKTAVNAVARNLCMR